MRVMRAGWGEDYKGRNGQKGHSVHEWMCVSAEPEASSSSACEATSVSPALLKKVQVNLTGIMESVSHTLPRPDGSIPRRALKVPARGASSHFVGSTIVILSSYAVATLAMNCGKKIQDQRMGTLKN